LGHLRATDFTQRRKGKTAKHAKGGLRGRSRPRKTMACPTIY